MVASVVALAAVTAARNDEHWPATHEPVTSACPVTLNTGAAWTAAGALAVTMLNEPTTRTATATARGTTVTCLRIPVPPSRVRAADGHQLARSVPIRWPR